MDLFLQVAKKPLEILCRPFAIERAHAFDKLFVGQFGLAGRHAHQEMEMIFQDGALTFPDAVFGFAIARAGVTLRLDSLSQPSTNSPRRRRNRERPLPEYG